ncbi:MAG: RAD55 family ATPase [Nitrososphaerota archaeon]
MPTPVVYLSNLLILATVIVMVVTMARSFPHLRAEGDTWVLAIALGGAAIYFLLNAKYPADLIGFNEYLYYANLLRLLIAVIGLATAISFLGKVGRISPKYIPPLFLVGIAISITVLLYYTSIGTLITYHILSFQIITYGFLFWLSLAYMHGLVGRILETIGLGTAIAAYGSSIVFSGVAALYLYTTGAYLSGLMPMAVYRSYLALESMMGIIGAAGSIPVVLKFPLFRQQTRNVEVVTGVDAIDREMDGRYPISVVVKGPPGSGRTSLLTRLASTRLKQGDGIAFFAFDDPVEHVRSMLREYGCEVDSFENGGHLIIVSSFPSPNRTEGYNVKMVPQEISIMLSQVLGLLRPRRKWVIIDSLTTIMDEAGASTAVKLLRILVAKAKAAGASLWCSYNQTAFPIQITSLVEDCMEGIVELALQERGGRLSRMVRVVSAEGRRVSGAWSRI